MVNPIRLLPGRCVVEFPVKLVDYARSRARYADLRAQDVTPREARGGKHSLELDVGKFHIDLVCFCALCNHVF